MARLPRLTLPGHGHVVRQEGVHGQVLAVDAEDERVLLATLAEVAAQNRVAIWAYALLPQALELVLCPETREGLGRCMQSLGRRYVQAFNRRHGRQGALWGSRFRAAVAESGEWLLAAMLSMEIRAMQAGRPSSAPHHTGERRDPLLSEPPVYWTLGNTPFEREATWRRRLEQGLPAETEAALARAVQGAWVLGTPAFAAEVEAALGRPAVPRPAGRPRRA